jgi:hypothetical protein
VTAAGIVVCWLIAVLAVALFVHDADDRGEDEDA